MSILPNEQMLPLMIDQLRAAGCVFAEDEADLLVSAARSMADLEDMLERRLAGLPLEPILGWAAFCGLRISVEPGVFVPRRRTEFLVRQAARLTFERAVVVDLCCGSGAVGAALIAALGPLELHAADIDQVAADCANRNLAPLGGHVYAGDLYDALPAQLRGRVDVLVANAPYVPTEAIVMMPAEARLYEPNTALDGGRDGLDVQRRVAAEAPRWLAPGGSLLMEISDRQAQQAVEILAGSGLVSSVVHCEELEATVVIGTKPALA